MKLRLQREAWNNATVIPYDKSHGSGPDIWCKEGELLNRSSKGKVESPSKILDNRLMRIQILSEHPYAK